MGLLNNIVSSFRTDSSGSSGVVGVDIGSSSIKVIELQEKKGVITLATYGEVQLGPYVNKPVGESVSLEPKQEQEALVDVIRESAVRARDAVFAMPLSSSFVTNVTIDADPDVDIASMVRIEARKVIPAPLNEVALDWAEVETPKKEMKAESNGKHNVLIAAIQNTALERFKILMQFAGLAEPPTEIEAFSSIRSLYDSQERDMAIIDIGSVSAKLYIAHNGLLMRMYRIRAGGTIATRKISEELDIDFTAAETMKCTADKQHEQFANMKRVHNACYDRAFREFTQVIREYEKKTGITLHTVYLSGGGALFPGVAAHLKSVVDKEVELANPFSNVAYPAFMEDVMRELGPSFTVALGAALRAFE